MSRAQAVTGIPPQQFAIGARVYGEDAKAVAEMANLVFGRRPQLHLSACVGNDGWATNAVGTLRLLFEATERTRIRTHVRILPEVQYFEIGARCQFAASNGGTVRVTVGGASGTITFTSADNGNEKTLSLPTREAGNGWLEVTVTLEQTSGGGTTNYLRNVRIEDEEITDVPGHHPGGSLYLVPSEKLVAGTTEALVGAAYLPAGNVALMTLLGEVSGTYAGSLRVRNASGTLIDTIGGANGLISSQGRQLTLPANNWYTFGLLSSNALGVAACLGITLRFLDEHPLSWFSVVPTPSEAPGTTETLVGAVYLSGRATTIRAYLGASGSDTGNLRIRDISGTLITTLTHAGAAADTTASDVDFTPGWHLLLLYGSGSSTIAMCHGIRFDMAAPIEDWVNVIPSPFSTTGTTETNAGSIWLPNGYLSYFTSLSGADDAAHEASLRLRFMTDPGSAIGTIGSPGILDEQTAGNATLSREGWVDLLSFGDDAAAVSNHRGLHFQAR